MRTGGADHRGCTVVIADWIVAGLLALFLLYAGGIKVVQTREQLRPMMAWVDSLPRDWYGRSVSWRCSPRSG
jgi:hypothetical protein